MTGNAGDTDNNETVRRDEIINQQKIELIDELFRPQFQTVTGQAAFDREASRTTSACGSPGSPTPTARSATSSRWRQGGVVRPGHPQPHR